jgi:hypothetical protein
MSIKSKVVAVAATLTLFGGVGAASALTASPASAATPSCGFTCINVFNQQFGKSFLQDVFQQNARTGTPIILFRSSNSDPALDFTVTDIANCSGGVCVPYTVAQICAGAPGLLGTGTCFRYASDYIWEVAYSPYGVNSGMCVGVAAGNVSGEGVTLQPCGVNANTWWIQDNAHRYFHKGHFYAPYVNAASANFTTPLVLTYPANGYPTDKPRPQLYVRTQQTFSNGAPYQNQMWSFFFGQA